MALTRKLLKSLGLEEAAIDTIIDAHIETTDALKKQRDDAMAEAGTTTEIAKERDQLKQQVAELQKQGGDAAKVQADFDAYKQQVTTEKLTAATDADLAAMAKEAGIQRESFRQMAVKTFDRELIKRGEDNAITNRAELIERMKQEYPDFLASEPAPRGSENTNPPTNNPAGGFTREQIKAMTPDEINRNWDSIKGNLAALK